MPPRCPGPPGSGPGSPARGLPAPTSRPSGRLRREGRRRTSRVCAHRNSGPPPGSLVARCSVRRMNRETRIAVVVGAAVLFGIGLVLGVALGRAGNDDEPPLTSPVSPTTATTAPSSVVVTPSPGGAPAISSDGAVLQEGDRTVVAAPSDAACVALIT